MVAHPDLQGLRRWALTSRGARGLYAKVGFTPLGAPETFMEIHDPGVHRRQGAGRDRRAAFDHLFEMVPSAYTRRPVTATKTRRKPDLVPADALAPFSRPVREWFEASFEAPTDAQARGWAAISAGHHTLIHAPTGSGKTLAAFLWTLDRLATHPTPARSKGGPPGPSASSISLPSRR